MIREIPLSLLVRQRLTQGAEFALRSPNAWLVWEAGAWSVPSPLDGSVLRTHAPSEELRDCLPEGDVLCFELEHPEGEPLRVGRALGNHVVVADATVSREHVTLTRERTGGWTVTVGSSRPLYVGVIPLEHGASLPLRDGACLQLGTVRLTFYTPQGFARRIQLEAERLRPSASPPKVA